MIEATENGRRMTLDPVMTREPLTVQPVRVESTLPCGFRIGWIDGKNGAGVSFDLACGAGVGGRYLILHVEQNGQRIGEEIIDMAKMVSDWVDALVHAGRSDGS